MKLKFQVSVTYGYILIHTGAYLKKISNSNRWKETGVK